MLDLQNVLSTIAIVLSCGALAASMLAYRQATKASLLDTQVKAVNRVLTAKSDVTLDGEITPKTVASIQEAFQLSSLVFGSNVKRGLDQAYRFAFHLQQTPAEFLITSAKRLLQHNRPQPDSCSAAKGAARLPASASCRSCQGTSRPSTFAVFMLIDSANSTVLIWARLRGFSDACDSDVRCYLRVVADSGSRQRGGSPQ